MSMCVFSLSSPFSLIILNAVVSDKIGAMINEKSRGGGGLLKDRAPSKGVFPTFSLKAFTPANNATPCHSLHSTIKALGSEVIINNLPGVANNIKKHANPLPFKNSLNCNIERWRNKGG